MSAPAIPGFAFVEHLGSGGFADVFLYEQQWPRQRVAVKVVRPDVPLTDREKYLFTAEANAMARLADHPYIVSVITAGVTAEGGRPFLVMRYCPPPDLGVRVRANPMAPVDAVVHRHQAGERDRDRAPLRHPAPRHQAEQRPGHHLPRAGADRLRHRRPHGRRRGRQRRPDLLPLVAARAARRPVQRLGRLRRLLPRRDHLAPARGSVAVLHPHRATTPPGRSARASCTPLPRPPSGPTSRPPSTGSSSSAWPSARSTGPASALELARALQRIESAAGWARTSVAVEGDRPDASVSPSEAPGLVRLVRDRPGRRARSRRPARRDRPRTRRR